VASIENRRFELAVERAGRAEWELPIRIGAVAVGTLAVAVGLFFSLAAPRTLPPGIGFRLSLGFVAAAGLFSVAVGVLLRPGPTEILVTGNGIESVIRGGERRMLAAWNDPKLRITLQDARESLKHVRGYLEKRSGMMWLSPGARGFDISLEALEGIVESAREAGLRVETVVTDMPRGLQRVKLITIRP
jgi:hypothetical protein